jgi:hypothetical protein
MRILKSKRTEMCKRFTWEEVISFVTKMWAKKGMGEEELKGLKKQLSDVQKILNTEYSKIYATCPKEISNHIFNASIDLQEAIKEIIRQTGCSPTN